MIGSIISFILGLFSTKKVEEKPQVEPKQEVKAMSFTGFQVTKEGVLVGRVKWEDLNAEEQKNIQTLVERINKLLANGYTGPTKINDGYRRVQDKPKNGSATSWHYKGAAIDLDDNDACDLWNWLKDKLHLLKECELWMEDPRWTHGSVGTWCHFQIYPPKSGKRIFIPSTQPCPAPGVWDGKYDKALDS